MFLEDKVRMAATQHRGDEAATCPLCDDYEGEPPSVEGHISSSTDPIHQGEVGRAYRADLRRQVAGTDGVESTDYPSKSATELGPSDDPSTGGGRQLHDPDTEEWADQEDGEMLTDGALDRQRSKLSEDGDDQEAADDQPGGGEEPVEDDRDQDGELDEEAVEDSKQAGVPIPVSAGTLIAGAAIVLVIVLMLQVGSGQDGDGGDDQEETTTPASQDQNSGLLEV